MQQFLFSRITDLRIKTYASKKEFVTLLWTAPGDVFNEGEGKLDHLYHRNEIFLVQITFFKCSFF